MTKAVYPEVRLGATGDNRFDTGTDPEYPGAILSGAYSPQLKSHVAEIIGTLKRFDTAGNPAITYLSAWHDRQQEMWYEYASPRFTGLLQCRPQELPRQFRHSILERRVYRKLDRKRGVETQIIAHNEMHDARPNLRNEGKAKGLVEAIYKVRLPDDRAVWLKDQASVTFFETDDILLSCGCLTDVSKEMEAEAMLKRTETALQKANHQLQQLATMDGLTQIANRRRLDTWIGKEWRRLTREKTPLSVIMCDIDHFKQYNDTYGHQTGDDCLKRVARAIAHTARRSADLAARYGGEEFIIALPNTTVDGALQVAREIQEAVRELKLPHANSPVSPFVTLSMGLAAVVPDAAQTYGQLIAAADQALYEAKKKGRNRIVWMADGGWEELSAAQA
jgi:diguanylate cyclase (GGDEF)-like protein